MGERFFERVIGLAALALLIFLFLSILAPFVAPLLWAITLTVSVWPLFVRLRALLGGHGGLAALLMTLSCSSSSSCRSACWPARWATRWRR